MKTLVFVGPPGCGKTTLAGNLFRSGLIPGRKIYIINDDGDGTEATVDAGILRGIEGLDLNALTSGCIGCKDEAEFREAVSAIHSAQRADWLIVEPVGYAAGHEVPNILHSLGIHPTVVCLVDVESFPENLVDGFMPTQIRVASAVGLTKYGKAESPEDSALEEVLRFIGEHNSQAPVFLLPHGSAVPEWVLHEHAQCRHNHNHDEPCDHSSHFHSSHNDDHDHRNHGVYSLHLKLRPEISYGDFKQVVSVIPGIFRGKGVVAKKQWHLVQGKWQPEAEQIIDDRPSFATLYAHEPLTADDFAAIAIPTEDAYTMKSTKQILGMRNASVEQTEALVCRRLRQFPVVAFTNRFGDLVTHPEILSVVHQLVWREGVARDVFIKTIQACVRYWISAANLLRSRDWSNSPSFAEWQRKLGIALGWYGWYHASDLGTELLLALTAARPARMLFEGLIKLRRLHSEFVRAKVQAEEVRDVAKFGLKYEGMRKEDILPVMSHCLLLAKKENRQDVASIWQDVILEIKKFDP